MMARDKTSIILYGNMLKAIAELPAESCLEMMKAISAHVEGRHFEFSNPILRAWFTDMLETFKRDAENFKAVCKKRSEAGRIGGLKSGASRGKAKQIEANEANACFASKNEANEADTDTDTDVPKGTKEIDSYSAGAREKFDPQKNPPTLEDVLGASKEPTIAMKREDAEYFFDTFTSSGWLDKYGNPITDWMAKLRAFAKAAKTFNKGKSNHGNATGKSTRNAGNQDNATDYSKFD